MLRRNKVIGVVSITVAILIVAAAILIPSITEPTPSTVTFGFATPNSLKDLYLSTFHVALVKGIFRKHVPEVRAVDFRGGTDEMFMALANNTVQVGIGPTHKIIIAIGEGVAIRIVSALTQDFEYSIAARQDFIQDHPDAVRGAVRAMLEANRLFLSDRGDIIVPLMKRVYFLPTYRIEEFRRDSNYSLDGEISKSALAKIIDTLLASGEISERPDLTKLLDEGFTQVAT